jgi:hypothetical protein
VRVRRRTPLRHIACAVVVLLSISAAHAQCSLPYTLANGQIAAANQVMANFNALAECLSPGGSTNSVQYNNGGTLGGVAAMSNGQLVIGATGSAPQAQALTAGPGVSITNGSGSISIATNKTEAGNGLYARQMSATPTSSGLGLTSWLNQGSATVADNAVGITIDAPTSGTTGNLIARYVAAPTAPYTITALIAATRNSTSANGVGIGWYDGSAKLHVLSYALSGGYPVLQVNKWTNATTFSANDLASSLNAFAQPIWLQLNDDGTNVSFGFSQDGSFFVTLFSVAKASGFLGATGYSNLVFFANPQGSRTFATLLSWIQS